MEIQFTSNGTNDMMIDSQSRKILRDALKAAGDRPDELDSIVPIPRDLKSAMWISGEQALLALESALNGGYLSTKHDALDKSLTVLLDKAELHVLDTTYARFFELRDKIVKNLDERAQKRVSLLPLTVDFNDASLDDVMAFVSKGITTDIVSRLKDTDGKSVTASFVSKNATNILDTVCKLLDIKWCISAGVVLLYEKDADAPLFCASAFKRPLTDDERKTYMCCANGQLPLWMRKTCLSIEKEVTANFADMPLSDVLKELSGLLSIKIGVADPKIDICKNNITVSCEDMNGMKLLRTIADISGLKFRIEKSGVVFFKSEN